MCEEKWDSGIYTIDHSEFDLDDIVSIRYTHNCRILFNGQYFILRTKNMNKTAVFDDLPLITEKPTEPGYYTYIIYSKSDSNKKVFVACKTLSILEIGTVHKAIAYRMNADKIHAAGEIYVSPEGKLAFNFISGTYMQNALNKTRKKRPICSADELEDFLIEKVKEVLGADAIWTSQTLIKSSVLPVTQEEIDIYLRHGATFAAFGSQEECMRIRNMPPPSQGGKRRTLRRKRHKSKKKRTLKGHRY